MVKSKIPVLLVMYAMSGSALWAQEVRAILGGRVTDPQGAVVPAADVVLISQDTDVKVQTKTNEQGSWTLEFLLPGHYRFLISAPGFKTSERAGIELQTADSKQIDVQLEVGSSSQSVEVNAAAPLIDTTSATSGTVITSDQILEMPSSSHVVSLLALLSPGVVQQDQNNNPVHMWSYIGASSFTANGGRNNIWSNSFQLDGSPNNKSGGYISFIPSQDSVQEFRVQTNAYDAAISRQAGATINMQTRSGSKAYHGTLYEFTQPDQLGANSFQSNLAGSSVAPENIYIFGGTIGGPVRIPKVYDGRQKTFFFTSFEETRQVYPSSSPTSLPTALERNGDFSQSWTTANTGGQLVRYPIQIYDPLTVVASTGNRTPFPGEVIPQNRLSPIALAMLKYLPPPNMPSDNTGNASNNYNPPSEARNIVPSVSVRVDQNWNNSNHSFGTVRWSHLHQSSGDTFGPDSILAGTLTERLAENIGLDHVWVISANKVLDVRYTLNRFEEPAYGTGSGFDPAQLGFPASWVSQLQKPSFPYITIANYASFGTTQADQYTNNTHHIWSGSLSHVHGNHSMRYGAEFWVLQQAQGGIGNQGEFDFHNYWTRLNNNNNGGTGDGSAFAAFLLGLPAVGNVPVNASAMYSQHFTGFYFQDNWRVSNRLTLNLGLRWDYERPVEDRFNRLTDRYDPNAINPISASAQAAYAAILAANASNSSVQQLAQLLPASAFKVPGVQLFAGVNGTPRTAVNADYHEWQPRLGFAYQIDRDTVVRGGFGRFTQADFPTGGQNGFSRTTDLVATQDNYLTPYDTLANPFHSGIYAPTGASLGALTNLGGGVNWDNSKLNRFYSWEYSLHLQRQWKSWLFEMGYSHNKTYNISWGWNENEPSFTLWQQLQTPVFSATGKPPATLPWNVTVPNPFYQLPGISPSASIYSSKTIALNQLLNPNPLMGGITENNPTGSNQYDGMQSRVEHRFSHGISLLTAFTWSELYEDTSFLGPQIAGPLVEHKLGGENRPLVFSVSPIWQVPVGRGGHFGRTMPKWADALVGGWEMSGNYRIQSGVPVVFGTASFFSGKDLSLPRGKQSLNEWFDTSQFYPFPNSNTTLATLATYPAWTGVQSLPGYSYVPVAGDTIKNGVYQDFANYVQRYPSRWSDVRASRVNNLDVGLYKTFNVSERWRVQLRANAFNTFNHPRFAAPDTNPSDSTFGRVPLSQQNLPRGVEFAVRASF
ncbi:TonB-dependent receptor [Candidatus Sulfopaludibacter sp. SbA3]|nr:TonB-dependent receptor [Candidatus Sulfopaludibacter sp. SbA3]